MLFADYDNSVKPTDRFPDTELTPILLGLFGEVGSIMAASKKHQRERSAYFRYRKAVEEEFGDALWYLAALSRRLCVDVDLSSARRVRSAMAVSDETSHVANVSSIPSFLGSSLDVSLLTLGREAASLLALTISCRSTPIAIEKLGHFVDAYLISVDAARLDLGHVMKANVAKVTGRFLTPDHAMLPVFDNDFPEDERLPGEFEIRFRSGLGGTVRLSYNEVFIGSPLSDNIVDNDYYRFHDVFHIANASILHWSPTFRALLQRKRKSRRDVDETQDSGRAIVIEEGLTAWIFSCAKQLDFFEDQSGVSFDILNTIREFVDGYEVAECPLRLWEDSILQGYEVFRRLRVHGKGRVRGCRAERRITFVNED